MLNIVHNARYLSNTMCSLLASFPEGHSALCTSLQRELVLVHVLLFLLDTVYLLVQALCHSHYVTYTIVETKGNTHRTQIQVYSMYVLTPYSG